MKKSELKTKVTTFNGDTSEAIVTIINAITAKGQRKKLLQNEKVVAILNRYGIEIDDVN